MVKSRYGRLADLRIDTQMTLMYIDQMKRECEDLGILDEVNEKLTQASDYVNDISRHMAEMLLLERSKREQDE
jgi:hypothetical protein